MFKSSPDCPVCRHRNHSRAEKRARWIAAGLCPVCGRERRRYAKCAHCRTMDSLRKKARYHRQRAA
jgi:hypothetical protein